MTSQVNEVSLTSETSLCVPLWSRNFRARELLPHLNLIAAHVDFPVVALGWCSNEVIEIHQAQELLKFTGDDHDKCLKVLEVYNQLKRHEDRVPFFLNELLKSGESSVTNQNLYDKLSDEMDFTDVDVQNACKNSTKLVAQQMRSHTPPFNGTESNADNSRKCSSPQHLLGIRFNRRSTSPQRSNHSTLQQDNIQLQQENTQLQQENTQLQQENTQLHKKLEQLQELLIETQKSLVSAQQELIINQNEKQSQQLKSSVSTKGRKGSMHNQSSTITEKHQARIKKLSRSLDSIQCAVMMMQLGISPETEYPPTGFYQLPPSPLCQKSYNY